MTASKPAALPETRLETAVFTSFIARLVAHHPSRPVLRAAMTAAYETKGNDHVRL
jgi:hypothetical protein